MDGNTIKNTVIGILAHVDAGKTTLAEQILYHTGSIRQRGRVDHRDTFFDSDSIEKERGITVFSEQADIRINGRRYTLLDTPGHVDFSAEMERALRVMDAAVVIVSAVEGIQGHTQTVWQLLRDAGVPTFFFVNKIDREGAQTQRVITELQHRFSEAVCDMERNQVEVAESLAELDEELMELYCSDTRRPEKWQNKLQQMVLECRLFPLFSGSALQDTGILEFLQGVDFLLPRIAIQTDCPVCAEAYKVRFQPSGERLVYLKLLRGTLSVKQQIVCIARHGKAEGKINSIFQCQGKKLTPIDRALPGMLCAVTGLDPVRPGDRIGTELHRIHYSSVPLLRTKVLFPETVPPQTMMRWFAQLSQEDPMLQVEWNTMLKQLHIHVMGTVQLEVLQQLVQERFGTSISFGPCEVMYQETIAAPVIGYGHFEPLRHYAEVHLRLEPAPRGSGITFESKCPLEVLDRSYQHLVEQHVFEKTHKGVLLGMPLTDVHITLLTGRAHLKHTEGGDFREATYRAIRQGLEQAQSIILEPIYAVQAEVEQTQAGRVMNDMERRGCTFTAPEIAGEYIRIQGKGPAAALMDYPTEFASFTKGKGALRLQFDGYQPCHNPQEVIERIGYDKSRDMENTSDSIFCRKGAGFPVKWEQAKDWMHCES